MHEIDLIQAVSIWINLSYTAAQWWITITTALIVGTYFAAKHIRPWLFVLIVLLYILSAASAVFEMEWYATLGAIYGERLVHAQPIAVAAEIRRGSNIGNVNRFIIDAVLVLGTLAGVAFSFLHWRSVRKEE